MKALIISESPLEKSGDTYYTVDPWITIPVHFSKVIENVTLLSPIAHLPAGKPPRPDAWPVKSDKLKIEELDYYRRYLEYWQLLPTRYFLWKKKLDQLAASHDVIILRSPAPICSMIRSAAIKNKKPLVLFILGDIATQPDQLYSPNLFKKYLYKSIIKLLLIEEKYTARASSIVYAYSKDIYNRYRDIAKKIRIVQDPHVSMNDFIYREDILQRENSEVKILRLCWLIPSKGVEYLIEALKILRHHKNINAHLEIIGQERKPGYLEKLKEKARMDNVLNAITFGGWVTYNKIGEVYFRNDIQVVSSLAEGIPRCIIEGFARGLPLVTTDVGGIKDFVTDGENALVIPPADSQAMADAIEKMIKDNELRRKLIKNGYDYAKKFSFEHLGYQMIEEIKEIAHKT